MGFLDINGLSHFKTKLQTLITSSTVGKLNKPSTNGTSGQFLKSNGDGTTSWASYVVSSDDIEAAVDEYMSGVTIPSTAIAIDSNLTDPAMAAQAKAAGDMIIIKDGDAPTEITNKLWIKRTPDSEVDLAETSELDLVEEAIAPDYDDLTATNFSPIKAGSLYMHNYSLYKAKQDINSFEGWTPSHWLGPINIASEHDSLKSALRKIRKIYTTANSTITAGNSKTLIQAKAGEIIRFYIEGSAIIESTSFAIYLNDVLAYDSIKPGKWNTIIAFADTDYFGVYSTSLNSNGGNVDILVEISKYFPDSDYWYESNNINDYSLITPTNAETGEKVDFSTGKTTTNSNYNITNTITLNAGETITAFMFAKSGVGAINRYYSSDGTYKPLVGNVSNGCMSYTATEDMSVRICYYTSASLSCRYIITKTDISTIIGRAIKGLSEDYLNESVYEGNPLSNEILFTVNDISDGTTISYDFTVPIGKATKIEFYDGNDNRIDFIGKGSSAGGDLTYKGTYDVPSGYKNCKFVTNADSASRLTHVEIIKLSKQALVNERISDIEDKIDEGENLIRINSLIPWTKYANISDPMFKTEKTPYNQWVTEPIDLGESKTRVYTGKNVYVVCAYNENGVCVGYKIASSQLGTYTFDFSSIAHRYIRCLIYEYCKNNCSLNVGTSVLPMIHNNNYLKNIDEGLIVEKRAFIARPSQSQSELNFYRMPFCAYTKCGTLLLGGENRIGSANDYSPTNIVFTRSKDNGKTFENPTTLLPVHEDSQNQYKEMTCGQFLINEYTGRIFCFCLCVDSTISRNGARTDKEGFPGTCIAYKYSDDDGATWSEEQSIDLRTSEMMIMLPAPGCGITLKNGTLVMPAYCQINEGQTATFRSLLLYSTDNGSTWNYSGTYLPVHSNECCAVEMPDGSVMINARPDAGHYRYAYVTNDLGATYTEHISSGYSMSTPEVSAALVKVKYKDSEMYLYSSPVGTQELRKNTRLYCSRDLISFKEIMSISDVETRGYTGIAVNGENLVIVEETSNDELLCTSMKLPQTVLNETSHILPIVNSTTGMLRGTLAYNKATGKIVFVDESGEAHNIAFET